MSDLEQKLTREDVAKLEIGHTDISISGAWLLVVLFLLTVAAVLPVQTVIDLRDPTRSGEPPQMLDIVTQAARAPAEMRRAEGGMVSRFFAGNRYLLKTINEYEDALEAASFLEQALLPPMQLAFTRAVGLGNEQAYLGENQWLFYRPGVDSVMGPPFLDERQLLRRSRSGNEWQPSPQPDPLLAIEAFRDQLAARGIDLVLMPCPIKASIQPEKLSPTYADRREPLQNPSHQEFIQSVEGLGIPVFDPSTMLAAMDGDPFLQTDTHWTPEAMDRCAGELADLLVTMNPALSGARNYQEGTTVVSGLGDIAQMLTLPEDQELYQPETVTIRPVYETNGSAWRRDESASVLLLGDSFSNIYSLPEMGWGAAAGFAERLSFHLRAPVDAIVRNDAGAHATRAELSRQLRRGDDRLAGKSIVVWEFAAREFAVGDWKELSMALPEVEAAAAPSGFLSLNISESYDVEGVIVEASDVPTPNSVPYKDHIRTLHLQQLRSLDKSRGLTGDETLVYIWSMRDNEWTDGARLAAGDRVRLRIQSWDAVSEELESINQSAVEDIDLQLEDHCWGELL